MELSAEGNGVEVNRGLAAAEMVGEEWDESDENYESEDDAYELTESKDNTLVDMCVKVLGRHLGDAEWCGRFAASLARDLFRQVANFNYSAPLPAELALRINSIHKNAQLANEIKSASLAKRATKDETYQTTTPTPSVW
jgi:hypothetical protein